MANYILTAETATLTDVPTHAVDIVTSWKRDNCVYPQIDRTQKTRIRKPPLEVEPTTATTLPKRTREKPVIRLLRCMLCARLCCRLVIQNIYVRHLVTCIHCRKVNIFLLWPWSLTYDLDLWSLNNSQIMLRWTSVPNI